MFLKRFSMTSGPKLRVSIFLRNALRLQDSGSYVQDVLKDTCGQMEDPHRSKRPDSFRTEAWTQVFIENVTERVQWKTCTFFEPRKWMTVQ